MARKRDYLPIGKNPKFDIYHKSYDRLRIGSDILNGGNSRPNAYTVIWDKARIIAEIASIGGNEKGLVYNKSTSEESLALLPLAKERLKKLQKDFRNFQQQRVNEGYFKPTEMPTEIHEQYLQLEARIDVYEEELTELCKRFKTFQDEIDEEHVQLLLAYGVAGGGSLHNNILVELDGQKISLNSNNVLIIDDELSPYDGLLVADYREFISKPWRIAKERLIDEKAKLSRKLISQGLYGEQFKADWDELQKRLIEENDWTDLFAVKLGGKPNIPKVPKHLKNYKEKV